MPDISIGAIGAAIIAALVSLMGLVVSKEQKTSEFRQAWIDALRAEIVNYTVHINAIADKLAGSYPDHNKKIEALNPHYNELNKASFGIRLRLNPKEKQSKNVIEAMDKFESLASTDGSFTVQNIRPIEKDFEKYAKKLLKHEWNRVKKGEMFFVSTKYSIIVILFILLIMASKIIFFQDDAANIDSKESQFTYNCTIRSEITPSTGLITTTIEAPKSSTAERGENCSARQEQRGNAVVVYSHLR